MGREEEDEANGLSFLFHNNFTKVYLECSKVLFQIRAVACEQKPNIIALRKQASLLKQAEWGNCV